MMNAELIDALRRLYTVQDTDNIEDWVYGSQQAMCDAAAALEAADKRIERLKKQEPTEKQVVDYCHKRCLVIVEEELFHRMKSTFSQLPKEGEWQDEQRGRWIYAKCNLCGKVQDARSNYCPNCGAKMDGERKDGEHEL